METHIVSIFFNILDRISVLQQAFKSSCSQITDMVQPEEGDGEEDQKKKISVEVRPLFRHINSLSNLQVLHSRLMKSRFHLVALSLNHLTLCVCADCAQEVHAAAIKSLAELTARSIELFHKLAEMVLFSGGAADANVLSQ